MPDYEITIAGRMGPVVASCLPGFRSVAPPGTVLHALVSNQEAALELLGLLAGHHFTVLAVRIDQAPNPPQSIRSAAFTPDPDQAPGMSATPHVSGDPPQLRLPYQG